MVMNSNELRRSQKINLVPEPTIYYYVLVSTMKKFASKNRVILPSLFNDIDLPCVIQNFALASDIKSFKFHKCPYFYEYDWSMSNSVSQQYKYIWCSSHYFIHNVTTPISIVHRNLYFAVGSYETFVENNEFMKWKCWVVQFEMLVHLINSKLKSLRRQNFRLIFPVIWKMSSYKLYLRHKAMNLSHLLFHWREVYLMSDVANNNKSYGPVIFLVKFVYKRL